jgi:hypothetical protein
MALVASVLATQLLPLFASETTPDNVSDCAAAWADAIETYSATIDPKSSALSAATAALEPLLTLAFTSSSAFTKCNTSLIENAFKAWAAIVAPGMVGQPSTVPVGTCTISVAPPGDIGFCSIGTQDDYTAAVNAFADKIDTWVKTGLAVIQLPTLPTPTYTLVNWS